MTKLNAVITDWSTMSMVGDVSYSSIEKLCDSLTVYDLTPYDENIIVERIDNAEVLLCNKTPITRNVMERCKNLKYIGLFATGFNNIDVDYARKRGIGVSNVAGYSTNAVVQHTFAMALGLLNEVIYHDNYVKSGEYSKSGLFTCLNRPYYEIQNKVWGIIGLGVIGRRVARIAEAFGAKVIYYSTSGRNNSSEFERVEFEELLNKSDIISIHAPLNNNTKGLINYDALSKMKNTAILVERDLSKAIDEDKIRGAALDVFEVEPINEENPLLTVKNKDKLLLSPHIAWASIEARKVLFEEVIENIKAFYRGEERNRV